jgi:hypothetical protein
MVAQDIVFEDYSEYDAIIGKAEAPHCNGTLKPVGPGGAQRNCLWIVARSLGANAQCPDGATPLSR